MIDLELGPVVGQTGGGVEIITEEVEIGKNDTRTWELPDGWEAGFVALAGEAHYSGYSSGTGMTLFGVKSASLNAGARGDFHAFGDLPGTISTDRDVTWSGTVTLIRTA